MKPDLFPRRPTPMQQWLQSQALLRIQGHNIPKAPWYLRVPCWVSYWGFIALLCLVFALGVWGTLAF